MSGGPLARVIAPVRKAMRTHARKHPWKWLTGSAAVALMVASAAFGGLQRAPEARADAVAPVVAKGTAVHAGPWDLTVERAVWTPEFPTVTHATDGDRWIVVVVTMTNTTRVTQPADGTVLDEAIAVAPFEGRRDTAPDMRLVSDGAIGFDLMPGLPTEVAIFIAQDGTVDPPATVDIDVLGYQWERRFGTNMLEWVGPDRVAALTVPVTEGTE